MSDKVVEEKREYERKRKQKEKKKVLTVKLTNCMYLY